MAIKPSSRGLVIDVRRDFLHEKAFGDLRGQAVRRVRAWPNRLLSRSRRNSACAAVMARRDRGRAGKRAALPPASTHGRAGFPERAHSPTSRMSPFPQQGDGVETSGTSPAPGYTDSAFHAADSAGSGSRP